MQLNFRILGFKTLKDNQYYEAVNFEVYAKSSQEALKKVKKLLRKNHYVIREITEVDDSSRVGVIKALDRMTGKMVKVLKENEKKQRTK